MGELVIDNGPLGHVHPLCAQCCGYATVTLELDSSFATPGQLVGSTVWGDNTCQGMEDVTSSCTAWWSSDPAVATVDSSGTVTGVAAGSATIWCTVQLPRVSLSCPIFSFQPNAPVNVGTVSVTSVSLQSDKVGVTLTAPSGLSGQLVVTWTGPGGNADIANATEGPGSYNYSPSLSGLVAGQYSGVTAKWTVDGSTASGGMTYNFNVLGTWRHSQYNTPTESSCTGSSASAYEVNVTTCAYQTNNLIAQFISQSWLNGSGKTIQSYYGYNTEQNAQYCINNHYLPGDASGKSFAFESKIVPYCGSGYSLGTSTVAWNFSSTQTLNCGDQVLLVGYGSSPGTVKTVTDRCGGACSNTQLDNYTTSAACNPHSFQDLGNFVTIRLGR